MKNQSVSRHGHLSTCWLLLILWAALLAFSKGVSARYAYPSDSELLEEALSEGVVIGKRGPANPGMWFGPRLGRRERRSVVETPEDVEDGRGEALVELVKDSPWTLIALKGDGRRNTLNFTPRLGRDSAEEDLEDLWPRSPPFAPRLGRRLVPFSPRLGRQPDVVYSPRLGRSLPPAENKTQ